MKPSLSMREDTYRSHESRNARDNLIVENLGYVRAVLAKTIVELPQHIDRENLEAAGVLGLVEAADHFDPTRGVEFKSFAYLRIRGAILDELRRNSPLPQRMLQLISKVQAAIDMLHGTATPELLAKQCDLTLDEIEATLEAMRLRQMHTWDNERGWMNQVRDSRQQSPDEVATDKDSKRLLAESIQLLPEKERLVITLYYLEDLRLREIGEVLNLSESRISRLLSKAEFRLSNIFQQRGESQQP
jgi:RNA polymerase sigma factor for flagellar operon FliA